MADIQLRKKNNGYWGCMDKDVRDAISNVVDVIASDGSNIELGLFGGVGIFGLVDATDDTDAAGKGVGVTEIYRTGSTLKVRVS